MNSRLRFGSTPSLETPPTPPTSVQAQLAGEAALALPVQVRSQEHGAQAWVPGRPVPSCLPGGPHLLGGAARPLPTPVSLGPLPPAVHAGL